MNCLTSLRWGEHCTGDHDWRAIVGKDRKRGVSGSLHTVVHVHVLRRIIIVLWRLRLDGVFVDVSSTDTRRRYETSFVSAVTSCELLRTRTESLFTVLWTVRSCYFVRTRERADVMFKLIGMCRRFASSGKFLGLRSLFVQTTECGREQDWGIAGADGTSRPLEVRWFNGDMGNCSSTLGARVVIDLLCRDP